MLLPINRFQRDRKLALFGTTLIQKIDDDVLNNILFTHWPKLVKIVKYLENQGAGEIFSDSLRAEYEKAAEAIKSLLYACVRCRVWVVYWPDTVMNGAEEFNDEAVYMPYDSFETARSHHPEANEIPYDF